MPYRNSNPEFNDPNLSRGYSIDYDNRFANYAYSHIHVANTPVALTGCITIGYIFK